jgi:hypothetical protein
MWRDVALNRGRSLESDNRAHPNHRYAKSIYWLMCIPFGFHVTL